jgi:hypothetical protein
VGWAKLCDNFLGHPRTMGLSEHAILLYIGALLYSAKHRTDGQVPAATPLYIQALWHIPNPRKAAAELVERGLWLANGDGWEIHDYLQYNPSREEIAEWQNDLHTEYKHRTEQARERMRRWRERKRDEEKQGQPDVSRRKVT